MRKLERQEEKDKKKQKKKAAKKKSGTPSPKSPSPKRKKKLGKGKGLLRDMKFITRLVKLVAIRLKGKLTVRIDELDLRLATGDAANTAYLYGAVSQSVSYLLTAAAQYAKLKVKKNAISVVADFTGEETTVKGKITLKIAVAGVLSLLISALVAMLKDAIKKSQQKP